MGYPVIGIQAGTFGDPKPSDPVFSTIDDAREWMHDKALKDPHHAIAAWRMPEAELLFVFLEGYELTPE